MKLNGENGKRRLGEGGGPSADRPGGKINHQRSQSILRLAASILRQEIVVAAEGDGWDAIDLGPYVDETPIGIAVLDVSESLELVVLLSARRKRVKP